MKYLITGSKGQLGSQFRKVLGIDGSDVDIMDVEALDKEFTRVKPDVVINCASYNDVQGAESNPKGCKVNSTGVLNVVMACMRCDCRLVHFSSNLIFDGKDAPYKEYALVNPLNAYGRSKLNGERFAMGINALIIRTSWLYGDSERNFIYRFLKRYKKTGKAIGTIDDIATPTSTRLVVEVTLKAIEKGLTGIYNVVNSGSASRFDWAKELVDDVEPVQVSLFNLLAKTPYNTTLDNSKISEELGIKIPDWREELKNEIKKEKMYDSVIKNIIKGKNEGLYRDDLDEEIIAKMQTSRFLNISTDQVINHEEMLKPRFIYEMFIYHIRGMANKKGIETLDKTLDKIDIKEYLQ